MLPAKSAQAQDKRSRISVRWQDLGEGDMSRFDRQSRTRLGKALYIVAAGLDWEVSI